MAGEWDRWRWRRVPVSVDGDGLHTATADCAGRVCVFTYRMHPPGSPGHERCAGLVWCSGCRRYGSGGMAHVPASAVLPDPLAELPAAARAALIRKERRLLDHLDRLVRRGTWDPPPPAGR